MTDAESPNAEQIKYWNEVGGPTWARLHARTESQLAVFGRLAIDRAAVTEGARVLDVGCGAGATTLALGRLVGPEGRVLGVDVSAPLLDLARQAAEGLTQVAFTEADASAGTLPQGAFDLMFSRFGVMFFTDPTAAFTQLARALRPGGRLCFACWRGAEHNPWMTLPLRAIAEHVTVEPPDPEAPGPLAFADEARVRRILTGAGFLDVALEPHDVPMRLGGAATVDEATDFLTQLGPAARVLRDAPADVVAAARVTLRAALLPHAGPEGVTLQGSVWIVTARVA
jgi:SAM-dependent methyltransferase